MNAASKPREWSNRIVGYDEVDPQSLMANPLNWRIHPGHQRAAVLDALQEVGWVQDIIVNKTTGNMIDGHLRVDLAVEKQEPLVPIKLVELSQDEERLVLASLDPLAGLAVADTTNLDLILEGLDVEKDVLRGFLEDLRQSTAPPPETPAATPHEDDFWPRVTFKIPHNAYASWQAAVAAQPGDHEHERIINMLTQLGFGPSESDD